MVTSNNTSRLSVLLEKEHIHTDLEIILVILAGVLFSLVTCIGNLLVILAYKLTPPLQTITHLFIYSMAISDFLIGIISVNFYVVYVALQWWPFGAFMCQIWNCLDYTSCQASGSHLIVICIDRFFSVKYPLKYRPLRTRGCSYHALLAVWLFSVFVWPPVIAGYPYIVGGNTVPDGKCYVQFTEDSILVTLITAAIAFYIPVFIIATAYISIFMIIQQRNVDLAKDMKQHARPPNDSVGRPNNLKELNDILQCQLLLDEKKAAKNLLLIFLNFFGSWLPYHILVVLKPIYPGRIPLLAWDIAYLLVYVNSAINPVCYAIRHKQFRRAMLRILKKFKINVKRMYGV